MEALKGSVKLGTYLKRLRTGYGYSLRKVEEKARQRGGDIDNSQLSRYEKGVCYPSFDKLRILANIFNVSIQSFSDVVDLERFESLKPEGGEPEELLSGAMTSTASETTTRHTPSTSGRSSSSTRPGPARGSRTPARGPDSASRSPSSAWASFPSRSTSCARS